MRIHDPNHVAGLAAIILSSNSDPEPFHVKKAVATARCVLDEAYAQADAEEAKAEAADKALAKEESADGKPAA